MDKGMQMDKNEEIPEYETGGLIEIVDSLCDVTQKLSDIVRRQAIMIAQEKLAGAMFPESENLRGEIEEAEKNMDMIEMKLRRM